MSIQSKALQDLKCLIEDVKDEMELILINIRHEMRVSRDPMRMDKNKLEEYLKELEEVLE